MDMLLILASLIITLGAQGYINSMYKKTKRIDTNIGMTGHDVARRILDNNGLRDVKIVESSGMLSDHYNPKNKTVNLSPEVFCKSSVAAVSVAAHECGHAIQDKEGYVFLRVRNSIVPLVNFASYLGYISIVIGLFTSALGLVWLGILMEFVILFFQLITLPVEFNASRRAIKLLAENSFVDESEMPGVKKVLGAAALTYIAATLASLMTLIRYILISNN